MARQRQADMQFAGLHNVDLPEHRPYRAQTTEETEMWAQIQEDPHGAGFDAGFVSSQRDTLLDLWNAESMGLNGTFSLDSSGAGPSDDKDDTDELLAEIMQNAAINDLHINDILNFEAFDEEKRSSEWSPYPSKMASILFLLDTLYNLLRLRISNSLMKVFLWILKESGAHDVPSFDCLHKGNIFHMNDPRTLVAKDWANPETRPFIHVYPEIPEDSGIREIWHAQKWRKDMDLDDLSPMWIKFKTVVCADAFQVEINAEGTATILDAETIFISSLDLVSNLLDLEDEHGIPPWSAETSEKGYPDRMPNPKRALAEGDPIYSTFIDYFGDDVSGNRHKSWNKHWNVYMTNRGLPRELLQQEYHVHFISTSPNASITEQFTVFKLVLELTHTNPVKVRDTSTQETTRLSIYANAGPSDNPMQSKITGHIGAKGNYMCRKCKTGGTEKEKEADTCFHSLFEPGVPRSKDKILTELKKQLIQWTLDNKDKIYSGFLTLKGFDPTKDTPVEILHTILLGVVKYIWHSSHTSWNTDQKELYSRRLQSMNTDSLSIHAIWANYIMQYANSLIGRQFKTITHVRGTPSRRPFKPSDPSLSLTDPLRIAAGNVLQTFAILDPTKILTKIKLHLLPHIPDDVVVFGPLIGVMTKIYECFNTGFRFCSILSNHLVTSRDIALQLADQEGLKHRLTGGWWPSGAGGEWEQASPAVRAFLHTRPVLQKLVGWTVKKSFVVGSVRHVPLPKKKKGEPRPQPQTIKLNATRASQALNCASYDMSTTWLRCRQMISASLDECKKAS
ncbi:hypothetical protein C8R46DRAFT_1219577 [Mycena filopes]|nr:hypothetical protein C8R46DRAFT_1219577 [Mycena filopes]